MLYEVITALDEDGERALRDGERLAQRLLGERPEDQREHERRGRVTVLLHEEADDARPEHEPGLDDAAIHAVGAKRASYNFV